MGVKRWLNNESRYTSLEQIASNTHLRSFNGLKDFLFELLPFPFLVVPLVAFLATTRGRTILLVPFLVDF